MAGKADQSNWQSDRLPDGPSDNRPANGESNVLVIAGPTASGKSSLALEIASRENGVIINADSQQIYKALPILSAQPGEDELQQCPHRLYNFLDPEEICDAHRWRELAKQEIHKALEAGKKPILVGGTGLYINAMVDGLSPVPDIPDEIRKKTSDLADKIGVDAFFEELKNKDPVMASRLDPRNKRRLTRAWEVLEATGRSLADWQEEPKQGAPESVSFDLVVIDVPREILRQRCDTRLEHMIELGALNEVRALKSLIDAGRLDTLSPITKALGFKPFKAWLEGEMTWDEALFQAKAQTRQYAKRQQSWFRHQLPENAKSVIYKTLYT